MAKSRRDKELEYWHEKLASIGEDTRERRYTARGRQSLPPPKFSRLYKATRDMAIFLTAYFGVRITREALLQLSEHRNGPPFFYLTRTRVFAVGATLIWFDAYLKAREQRRIKREARKALRPRLDEDDIPY